MDPSQVLVSSSNQLKTQIKICSVQRFRHICWSNSHSCNFLGQNSTTVVNRYVIANERIVIVLTFMIHLWIFSMCNYITNMKIILTLYISVFLVLAIDQSCPCPTNSKCIESNQMCACESGFIGDCSTPARILDASSITVQLTQN